MIEITFYAKEGCWLCDHAEELLNGLKLQYNLKINRIEITEDDEIYEKFRFEIPVIEFSDGRRLRGRIKKEELKRYLNEYKK
jgi:glutaredoxin